MSVCDFCSRPNPTWRYPADSFLDEFGSRSVEDWMACDDCHALIEAGDCNALAARVMLTPTAQRRVVDPSAARRYARRLHDRFFEHRLGPAIHVAS